MEREVPSPGSVGQARWKSRARHNLRHTVAAKPPLKTLRRDKDGISQPAARPRSAYRSVCRSSSCFSSLRCSFFATPGGKWWGSGRLRMGNVKLPDVAWLNRSGICLDAFISRKPF